ncbi:hypothetical protein K458DRAFT_401419 [Lentithecium fluviatile CBS 122367]|uniref:Uncharacterized protein n=1 Tax=Lentithecium fluviatile CBS 122367 TaxID=1168545 RepID=A0A6G1JBV4_9PLEO|nr:hypothetical protein K458DRAFT_401419 [Lentithecium fluviatile CBS 122367]
MSISAVRSSDIGRFEQTASDSTVAYLCWTPAHCLRPRASSQGTTLLSSMATFDSQRGRSWNVFHTILHPPLDTTGGPYLPLKIPCPSRSAPIDIKHPYYPTWTASRQRPPAQSHWEGFSHFNRHHEDFRGHESRRHASWDEGYEELLRRPLPEYAYPEFPSQWSFESSNAPPKQGDVESRPVSPFSQLREERDENGVNAYQSVYTGALVDVDVDRNENRETENPSSTFPRAPDPPSLGTDRDLARRWDALSSREEELTAREVALEEAVKQLEQDRNEITLREQEMRQREYELLVETWELEGQRRRWRPPFACPSRNWQPNVFAEGMEWERELDSLDAREYEWGHGLDDVFGERRPQFWEDRNLPPIAEFESMRRDVEAGGMGSTTKGVRKAFKEYNAYWDTLQRSPSSFTPTARMRFPTLSGDPSKLLADTSDYTIRVRPIHLPATPSSLNSDEIIRLNVYNFFLTTFSIPVSYTLPGYQAPRFRHRQSDPHLDFRGADLNDVKCLRDHLLRKELNRWHPDKLNRWLHGEGKDVVSQYGSLRMTEREVAACVDQAVRSLKSECDEVLKRATARM